MAASLPSIRDTPAGAIFAVRVQPRAKKNAITGVIGDALKTSLSSPAIEGRANDALVEFFASLFEVSRAAVTILSGDRSRNKVVRIAGRTAVEILHHLSSSLADP